MSSQAAVAEAVEQAVRQVVDCARVRLLPVQGPLWTPGSDSAGLGRFLPKVAQAMAAAIAHEQSGNDKDRRPPERKQNAPSGESSPVGGTPAVANPTPVEGRNLRALRRVVKMASLFALTAEQETALGRGELVYLTPKASMMSSVPALWSWLLVAVRFRDRIVGLLAVAPKSVAQIFTSTSESLLRTIANHAALALYCASVSEQFEALRRAQEGQAREQLDAAVAALADEIAAVLSQSGSAGEPPSAAVASLLEPLRALATPRPLKRQPQALRLLVDRARQLLRGRLASRLLEVDLAPALEIDSDGSALVQVLGDLLANSLDGCAAPGRVGVTASVEADQRLRISIWDSGASPLFEGERLLPLVSATDKRTAAFRQVIAHRLVQAHGWEWSVARRSDRNSTAILVPSTDWRRRRASDHTDDEDEALAT
jgi:signal transduction histidine kinase